MNVESFAETAALRRAVSRRRETSGARSGLPDRGDMPVRAFNQITGKGWLTRTAPA
jgi:hypothetical protein